MIAVADDDAALVRRALTGDQQAYAALYTRHAPVLLVRMRRILGHAHEAEDLLQVLFTSAFARLRHYDARRPLAAWLHGFAFHLVGRALRARTRRRWLLFGFDSRDVARSALPSPELSAVEREQVRALYAAMDKLSEKQRIVFALCALDGVSLTEAADLLSISVQAVSERLQLARAALARSLVQSEHLPNRGVAARGE